MSTLVGKEAPRFDAPAVINGSQIIQGYSLDQYLDKKYVVFFFYPMDFTFVCPTELHAFQQKLEEFDKRDVVVVGCSVDSEYSHYAWLNIPKNEGGIQGVKYPLVADFSKTIAQRYGVLAADYDYDEEGNLVCEGNPVALRGLFLIDKKGFIRHEVINDLSLGRNIDEVLRMVDALIHVEKYGEVCPANWTEGDKAIKETTKSVADYLSEQ
mgnify:FL=1